MSDINPITIIKESRFNHFLIDYEFVLEIKRYENIYLQLKEIGDMLDELKEMTKWYYIPLSIIKDVIDFWKSKTLKSKMLWVSFWICCFIIGLYIGK